MIAYEFPPNVVALIQTQLANGRPLMRIARERGVHRSVIQRLVDPSRLKRPTMSERERRNILSMHEHGLSVREIAKTVHRSKEAVTAVWKDA